MQSQGFTDFLHVTHTHTHTDMHGAPAPFISKQKRTVGVVPDRCAPHPRRSRITSEELNLNCRAIHPDSWYQPTAKYINWHPTVTTDFAQTKGFICEYRIKMDWSFLLILCHSLKSANSLKRLVVFKTIFHSFNRFPR